MKHRTGTIVFGTLAALLLMTVGSAFAEQLLRTTLKVENLTCNACLANIAGELKKHPEAAGMDADLSQGLVVVDHTPALGSEAVAATITKLGYPATVIATDEISVSGRNPGSLEKFATGAGGGCCKSRPNSQPLKASGKIDQNADLTKTTFQVDKLTCGACLDNIRAELAKLEGAVDMSADLGQGLVAVTHAKTLTADAIAAAITNIGYPAKVAGGDKVVSGKTAESFNSNAKGRGCGGGCNATASSWQQLYHRYFGEKKSN